MHNSLSYKNIIVTGATSGLGKSLSKILAKQESNLMLVARSKEKLLELKNSIENKLSKIEILDLDLSEKESPKKIYDFSLNFFEHIDVIINNAGIGYNCFVTNVDQNITLEVFQTNFFSIVEINKLFLPLMIKRNQGSIVNISSFAGKKSLPTNSIYCASKFALEAYTEALRCELKTTNINIINVRPSFLYNTNFFKGKFVNAELGSNFEKKIKATSKMSSDIAAKKILKSILKKSRDLNLSFLGKILIILNPVIPNLIDTLIFQLRKKNIIKNLKKIQENKQID